MEAPLTREENVLLWCVHTMDGLREKGLVDGGCQLSADGAKAAVALKASGFQPTDAEISSAMAALMNPETFAELDDPPAG